MARRNKYWTTRGSSPARPRGSGRAVVTEALQGVTDLDRYNTQGEHMLEPWTVPIASHAVAASLALVLGPYQILRPVRGDKIHVFIGRTWAGLMVYVALGSFLFGGYGGPIDIFLRLLAIWTLFSVTMAIYRARRADIRHHRRFMIGTYLGLVGAFIGVVAVHTRRVPSWFAAYPLMMSIIAVAIVAAAGFFVGGVAARHRTEPSGAS